MNILFSSSPSENDITRKSMNTTSNQSNPVEALPSTTTTKSTTSSSVLSIPDAFHAVQTSVSNNSQGTTNKSMRCFSCSVCNIDLFNQKQFNSHLNSQQHQQAQSVHDVLQTVAPEYRSAYKAMFSPDMLNRKVFNRELRCEEQIKLIKEPLLGLNYIIEFQFENVTDPPRYVCELCHCKCSLQSILAHLISIQHQQKFLKIHHPDMFERVQSASNIRSEQQRLITNYAKQIQSRHGGPGNVQLHIQLDSFIGQKPVVLAVTLKSQSLQHNKGQMKAAIQLTAKTFEEYNYPYEDQLNQGNDVSMLDSIADNHGDSIRGLSPEDLLYPFDRQYWYDNYKDLLESRPIDPHSVTYQETMPGSNDLQPFQGISKNTQCASTSVITRENSLTLENGQTIRRNVNQPSNRRVILDTNRTPMLSNSGILRISPTQSKSNFDGYTLLNEQQKKSNGINGVLNEQSARAILAASGLLQSDDEDESSGKRLNSSSSRRINEEWKKRSEQTVSPAIAKRMLDAVLNGDLDVAHIQPYFSTFVNLIQSGQIELERHQAERLLHKVLVTSSSSSPAVKVEPISNSHKRARSNSHSREHHSSSASSTSTTRRVHLINESKTTNRN